MEIRGGAKTVWQSTLDEFNEAVRIQLQFHYYLATLTSAIVFLTLAPFTTLGNLLVIATFCKDPYNILRAAPSNILLVSLALSDFFVGAIQSPLTAYFWIATFINEASPFSFTILCSVNAFVFIVFVLHLLALSFDRSIAVVTSLKYISIVTKQTAYITVGCIWVYSLIIACASVMLRTTLSSSSLISVHVVISWAGLTFLNTRVMHRICTASARVRPNVVDEQLKIFERREREVTKLVFLILGVYALCYLPWFISVTLYLFCSTCDSRAMLYCYGLSGILLYVSPLAHPFLYTWRLSKFRQALRHFFNTDKSDATVKRCNLRSLPSK